MTEAILEFNNGIESKYAIIVNVRATSAFYLNVYRLNACREKFWRFAVISWM